jgi:hypothetical protein
VISIPTVMIFKQGQIIERMVGVPPNVRGVLGAKVKGHVGEATSTNGTAG